MKIILIEEEEQDEWRRKEKGRKEVREWRKDDESGGGREGEGWSKEAMSHISDLDPCGLLFNLVTPSWVCMCVWWHVQVVNLLRATQTYFKQANKPQQGDG